MRTHDPWSDGFASDWGDQDARFEATGRAGEATGRAGEAAGRESNAAAPQDPSGRHSRQPCDAHDAVYLTVQRSAAFQQVRRRYRRFVLPASVAFLAWYLAYLITATVAPGLMAHPLYGVFNVAMAAGLAQFASTFLLTWAYMRHARLRRDQLALELRWETQDMARTRTVAQLTARTAPAPRTVEESTR